MIGSKPVAAAMGEFGTSRIQDFADQYYNPQTFNQATKSNMAGEALAPSIKSDMYYVDEDGEYVDRSMYRQSYDEDIDTGELIVPGYKGPQGDEGTAPAPLTVVPTSSKDKTRPRTVAAGYDKSRQCLTVVFRDGTWYNYYEVTNPEWVAFKSNISKGQYIYKYLDFKPRGPADLAGLSAGTRKKLYSISRAYQLGSKSRANGGKSTGKIN